MEEETYRTSLLESGSLALIYRLYQAGTSLNLSELEDCVPNFYALKKRAALMEQEGLVNVALVMDPRKVVRISLTDKGEIIGGILAKISRVLPNPDDLSDSAVCMKYAEPVIVMLYRKGKLRYIDILDIFPNYKAIVKSLLPALETEGLVKLGKEKDHHKSNTAELTMTGKMVGAGLDEIHRIVTGE